MRLNKMKLAAAMMSAVMAASSMPVTAFAADFTDGGAGVEAQADFAAEAVEVVETPEDTVEDVGVGQNITIITDSVQYVKDTKKVKFRINIDGVAEGDDIWHYADATTTVLQEATCEKVEVSKVTATSEWGHALVLDRVVTGEKLPHSLVGAEFVKVGKVPTCQEAGYKATYQHCSLCDKDIKKEGSEKELAQDPDAHSFTGTTVVTYEVGDNVIINDTTKEEVELEDPTRDGLYYVVTKQKCAFCEEAKVSLPAEKEISRDPKTVTATEQAEVGDIKVRLPKNSNIVDDKFKPTAPDTEVDYSVVKNLKDEEIKLGDCTIPGKYEVVYYKKQEAGATGAAPIIRVVPVEVKAHHTTKVELEYKNEADKGMLVATVDAKTGALKVTNKSCNKAIPYYEVTKCTVCTKYSVKSEEKVAEPSDNHVVSLVSKEAVKKAVDAANNNKGVLSKADFLGLEEAAKAENSGIKITTTDACVKDDATITVTYLCDTCGKETGKPVEIKVVKIGHDNAEPVEDESTKVEATCDKAGKVDTVVYCKRCGVEVSRRKGVEIPRLKHSFEDKDGKIDESKAYVKFNGSVVVDLAGGHLNKKGEAFNPDLSFLNMYVTASAVVDCTNCNKAADVTADLLKAPSKYDDGTLEMKVVDIEKESVSGTAGFITLEATFSKTVDKTTEKVTDKVTVPYFSNFAAYLERNPDAKNGLVRDDDGVFRYYIDGKFQEDYTGLVDFNGETFFVENGVDTYKDGVVRTGEKTFYFLSLGRVVKEHNGFAMYDGNWFIIKDGKVDLTANGLFKYNGGTFLFTTGGLRRDVTGLWLEESTGTWYYLHEGQVQDQFTGTTWYDGQQFELVNGKLVK